MDRKEYMRQYMANKRKGVNTNVNKDVNKTPENVNKCLQDVNKDVNKLPKEWQHIVSYISRDVPETEPNKMPYLERLQRIAGSLGHNAGDVWFSGLTMQDVGETIDTLPPKYA